MTTWTNQDEAFLDIARGIRAAVSELKEAQSRPSSGIESAEHPGPEVVLEYECDAKKDRAARRNPLTLRNLGGWHRVRGPIEPITNEGVTARFETISHIPEGGSVSAASLVESVKGLSPLLRDDFVLVLEASYKDKDAQELFTPIRVPVLISYSDVEGREFQTECEIEFHHFHKTAKARFERRIANGRIGRREDYLRMRQELENVNLELAAYSEVYKPHGVGARDTRPEQPEDIQQKNSPFGIQGQDA